MMMISLRGTVAEEAAASLASHPLNALRQGTMEDVDDDDGDGDDDVRERANAEDNEEEEGDDDDDDDEEGEDAYDDGESAKIAHGQDAHDLDVGLHHGRDHISFSTSPASASATMSSSTGAAASQGLSAGTLPTLDVNEANVIHLPTGMNGRALRSRTTTTSAVANATGLPGQSTVFSATPVAVSGVGGSGGVAAVASAVPGFTSMPRPAGPGFASFSTRRRNQRRGKGSEGGFVDDDTPTLFETLGASMGMRCVNRGSNKRDDGHDEHDDDRDDEDEGEGGFATYQYHDADNNVAAQGDYEGNYVDVDEYGAEYPGPGRRASFAHDDKKVRRVENMTSSFPSSSSSLSAHRGHYDGDQAVHTGDNHAHPHHHPHHHHHHHHHHHQARSGDVFTQSHAAHYKQVAGAGPGPGVGVGAGAGVGVHPPRPRGRPRKVTQQVSEQGSYPLSLPARDQGDMGDRGNRTNSLSSPTMSTSASAGSTSGKRAVGRPPLNRRASVDVDADADAGNEEDGPRFTCFIRATESLAAEAAIALRFACTAGVVDDDDISRMKKLDMTAAVASVTSSGSSNNDDEAGISSTVNRSKSCVLGKKRGREEATTAPQQRAKNEESQAGAVVVKGLSQQDDVCAPENLPLGSVLVLPQHLTPLDVLQQQEWVVQEQQEKPTEDEDAACHSKASSAMNDEVDATNTLCSSSSMSSPRSPSTQTPTPSSSSSSSSSLSLPPPPRGLVLVKDEVYHRHRALAFLGTFTKARSTLLAYHPCSFFSTLS